MTNITDEAILKSIENIAPKAWQMLVEKQRLDAIVNFEQALFVFSLSIITIILVAIVKSKLLQLKTNGGYPKYDKDITNIICYGLQAFAILFILACINDSFAIYNHYTHPENFAAENFLSRSK